MSLFCRTVANCRKWFATKISTIKSTQVTVIYINKKNTLSLFYSVTTVALFLHSIFTFSSSTDFFKLIPLKPCDSCDFVTKSILPICLLGFLGVLLLRQFATVATVCDKIKRGGDLC